MVLSTRRSRHGLATKVAGALFVVFALVLQPIVALNVPAAFATTGNVVINEFSANNGIDWVELYNPTVSAVTLDDWYVRDNSSGGNILSLSGVLAPGGWLSFDYSDKLNKNNDEVRLFDAGGTLVDLITYGNSALIATPDAGQYAARATDGAAMWEIRSVASKAATNNPTPTPPEVPEITAPTTGQYFSGASTTNSWTPRSDAVLYEVKYELMSGSQFRQTNATSRTQTFTGNYQGPITISVRAKDAEGNWSAFGVPVTYYYDSVASVVSTNVDDGNLLTGVENIEINTTDEMNPKTVNIRLLTPGGAVVPNPAGGNFGYYRASGTTNSNTWVFNTEQIADGSYTLQFAAKDAAGNKSLDIFRTVMVDNTNPQVTVKNGFIGDLATKSFQKVSFKLFDANKIDKVTLNGVTKNLTNNKWSDINNVKPGVFGAQEGDNELIVYDLAGNITTYTFTLDTVTPGVPTLISPANGAIVNTSTPVANDWEFSGDSVHHYVYESYNLNEDGTCNYDASLGEYMVTDSQTAARTMDDGVKFCWRVRVIDAAMNVGEWSDTWVMTVDNTYVPPVQPEDPTEPTPIEEVNSNEGEKEVEVTNESDNVAPERLPSLRLPIANPIVTPGTTPAVVSQQADRDTPEVLSATDTADTKRTAPLEDTADVLGANTTNSGLFGIAWYWWLVGIAAIVALWWTVAGMRRRGSKA